MTKGKKNKSAGGGNTIALNKQAGHEYHIEQRFECGLALEGWEVKGMRAGRVQLKESYVKILHAEAFLIGAHISPLASASTHVQPDPTRSRKLLLHRAELNRLIGQTERAGYTLVPTSLAQAPPCHARIGAGRCDAPRVARLVWRRRRAQHDRHGICRMPGINPSRRAAMTPMPIRPPTAAPCIRRAGAVVFAMLLLTAATASAQGGPEPPDGMLAPMEAPRPVNPDGTGIEALPGSDLWLKARLIASLSSNAELAPFEIGVSVDDGTAILTGSVDTEAQRALAARVAGELTGIARVENRILVAPAGSAAPRSDPFFRVIEQADIATRVKLQLLWRRPGDGVLLHVSARDDRLVLTGEVASSAARARAERIARRTAGVAAVENELRVNAPAVRAEEAAMAKSAQPKSDAWIETRVLAALRFDGTLDAERVAVSAEQGVVTLTGAMPTAAQKADAALIAGEVDGVQAVANELGVDGAV